MTTLLPVRDDPTVEATLRFILLVHLGLRPGHRLLDETGTDPLLRAYLGAGHYRKLAEAGRTADFDYVALTRHQDWTTGLAHLAGAGLLLGSALGRDAISPDPRFTVDVLPGPAVSGRFWLVGRRAGTPVTPVAPDADGWMRLLAPASGRATAPVMSRCGVI